MSQRERRLAAIMFTDMVGYTALGQRNEELSFALVEEHRKLVRPILGRHGGREVKTIGDAFLVVFSNALEAVRCGCDIQRGVREFNVSLPEDRRVNLRIGIHVGDIVESGGDISGDAVNIASRIEQLAEEGGVCISRQVYDQVQNKLNLAIESMGIKSVKNVSWPLEIFKIVLPWNEKSESRTQIQKTRIAVLPFTNISPDPSDEYFADGMTEELITKLSELKDLRVIARTSIMNYKKKEKNIHEISRELGVGSIIEGSVRKSGDKIRITIQLIDARTEEHVWASSYDRDLGDIFAIQTEVAAKVSTSLLSRDFSNLRWKDTDDIEAYTLYLRATALTHEGTQSSLKQAIGLFEQASSKDPSFVRAYAGLCKAWIFNFDEGYEDALLALAKAETAGRKAVELDSESAEAHAVLSVALCCLDKFQEGMTEAQKSVEINPSLSEAYRTIGICYSVFGTLEEGLSNFQKGYELDPLSLDAGGLVVLSLRLSNKLPQAIEIADRLKNLNPKSPRVYSTLADCYIDNGNFDAAQEMLDIGFQISPQGPRLLFSQGVLHALRGHRNEAERVLSAIREDSRESVRLYGTIFVQAALGNVDEVFTALMRGVEIHVWPYMIKFFPVFEQVRRDARFSDFCKKANLPM